MDKKNGFKEMDFDNGLDLIWIGFWIIDEIGFRKMDNGYLLVVNGI